MKVIDYTILSSEKVIDLAVEVNEHIQQGWQPTGGLAADEMEIFQAMVKYEEDEGV
jgi:hypothetical protein